MGGVVPVRPAKSTPSAQFFVGSVGRDDSSALIDKDGISVAMIAVIVSIEDNWVSP